MKTIIVNKYNSLDDLSLTEMDNLSPKNNEVLIKVHSSIISSYDMRMFKGKPFMIRFQKDILSPQKRVGMSSWSLYILLEWIWRTVKSLNIPKV